MALQTAVINVMQAAARKAARPMLRDFGELENLQVSRKGPSDFVTAADLRTDKILREDLGAVRPVVGVLTEDSGDLGGGEDKKTVLENSKDILSLLDLSVKDAASTFKEVARLEPARFAWEPEKPVAAV